MHSSGFLLKSRRKEVSGFMEGIMFLGARQRNMF